MVFNRTRSIKKVKIVINNFSVFVYNQAIEQMNTFNYLGNISCQGGKDML